MASSTETKTYKGSCHCGAFEYELTDVPIIKGANRCNCSICARKGIAWVFAPSKDAFKVVKGEGTLREYTFGKGALAHYFCPTCGSSVMASWTGKDSSSTSGPGLNAKMIPDLDIWALKMDSIDGQSFAPAFEPHPLPKHDLVTQEGEKIYTGSCHCGAVGVAVRTKPLPEVDVRECNCSICSRSGRILCYPERPQVQVVGEDNLTRYRYGSNDNRFCKTCGIYVDLQIERPPEEKMQDWPDSMRERLEGFVKMHPVNIRILDGVEWKGQPGETEGEDVPGKVQVKKVDGKSFPAP